MCPLDEPKPALRSYAVAFIDFLGQRKLLEQMTTYTLQDPAPAHADNLRHTFDVILRFRNAMHAFQPEAGSSTPAASLHVFSFSDTLVAHVPFDVNNPHEIRNLFHLFGACATAVQLSLSLEQPVRGGIALGWGAEIGTYELYGPAYMSAYALEQQAHFPRLLIDPRLACALREVAARVQEDVWLAVAARHADACMKLISEDEDGALILDAFGQGYRSLCEENADWRAEMRVFFTEAQEFISGCRARCRTEVSLRALWPKYDYLYRYLAARAPLWEDVS